MKKYYEELLKEFIKSESITGRSEETAAVFKLHADSNNFTTGVDMLGSVVARLTGQTCYLDEGYKRRVLITAHQDSFDFITNEKEIIPGLDKTIRGKYRAPGLDNKAGILSMCILMELVRKSKIYDDLYFVATALDREGGLGSCVCAEKINPTIAINMDVVKVHKRALLGKGPVIINSSVINKKLFDLVNEVSIKYKIPIQSIQYNKSSDLTCSKVTKAAGGIACCDIRVPMYQPETGMSTVSKKDIENCAKLVHKLIVTINRIESFLPEV